MGLTLGEGFWSNRTQNEKGLTFLRATSPESWLEAGRRPGSPEALRIQGPGLRLSLADKAHAFQNLPKLTLVAGTSKPTLTIFDTCYGFPPWYHGENLIANAKPGQKYGLMAIYNRYPLLADTVRYRELNAFQMGYFVEALLSAQLIPERSDAARNLLKEAGRLLIGGGAASGDAFNVESDDRLEEMGALCQMSSEDAAQLLCSPIYSIAPDNPQRWREYAQEIKAFIAELRQAPHDFDTAVRLHGMASQVSALPLIFTSQGELVGHSSLLDLVSGILRNSSFSFIYARAHSEDEIDQAEYRHMILLDRSALKSRVIEADAFDRERLAYVGFWQAFLSDLQQAINARDVMNTAKLEDLVWRPELMDLAVAYAANAAKVGAFSLDHLVDSSYKGPKRSLQVLPRFFQALAASRFDALKRKLPPQQEIDALKKAAEASNTDEVLRLIEGLTIPPL